MEPFNDRLAAVLIQLKSTNLVKSNSADSADVLEFFEILNKASPITDRERSYGDAVRLFFKNNNTAFCDYLKDNNLFHLILLSEGQHIGKLLGVDDRIVISWNRASQQYVNVNPDYPQAVFQQGRSRALDTVNKPQRVKNTDKYNKETRKKPYECPKTGDYRPFHVREAEKARDVGKKNTKRENNPRPVTKIPRMTEENISNILAAEVPNNTPKYTNTATLKAIVRDDESAEMHSLAKTPSELLDSMPW